MWDSFQDFFILFSDGNVASLIDINNIILWLLLCRYLYFPVDTCTSFQLNQELFKHIDESPPSKQFFVTVSFYEVRIYSFWDMDMDMDCNIMPCKCLLKPFLLSLFCEIFWLQMNVFPFFIIYRFIKKWFTTYWTQLGRIWGLDNIHSLECKSLNM